MSTNDTSNQITLNEDQEKAINEIIASYENGNSRHVLTGNAGTGKTTLVQILVARLKTMKKKVAITAPTHKAVAVLSKKLEGSVETFTIHSFLGLKPTYEGEKTILKRGNKAAMNMVNYDVVVIDEASMIGKDLFAFIEKDLTLTFVLFVGDPAQLPPVNEEETECFHVKSASHLTQIVRQAAENPIIQAAQMIRDRQHTTPAWEWTRETERGSLGVYRADHGIDQWMEDAFTSDEFTKDNDNFRYLCYTNDRVAQINKKIRGWIYGETPTPFVVGERAICRSPVLYDGKLVFSINEEVTIEEIYEGTHFFEFPAIGGDGKNKPLDDW